jgi:hypothetical protein
MRNEMDRFSNVAYDTLSEAALTEWDAETVIEDW